MRVEQIWMMLRLPAVDESGADMDEVEATLDDGESDADGWAAPNMNNKVTLYV